MRNIQELNQIFNNYFKEQKFQGKPAELYEPFEYILSLGGKRMRPLLVLMSYELFGKDAKDVLPQAYAVELFHNFTLMHDDIMDNAALRRGSQTVHTKFGLPAAILSGDVMLIYAYEYLLMNRSNDVKTLLELFNKMAIGVCEGQQLDLVFEKRGDVTSDEYIQMIELKTALLLGTTLQIGAVLANADERDANNLYNFGINTGIAFQLLDDLLDAFGDERVGKTTGGDIVQNKKTILYIEALHQADSKQRERLQHWYSTDEKDNSTKISEVKKIFTESGALERTQKRVGEYHDRAIKCLNAIDIPADAKKNLTEFSELLMQRTH